jgi:hypothetical protein
VRGNANPVQPISSNRPAGTPKRTPEKNRPGTKAGETSVYCHAIRSSTSVDSPPPRSIIAAERSGAARSMNPRETSRCALYELAASGALVP